MHSPVRVPASTLQPPQPTSGEKSQNLTSIPPPLSHLPSLLSPPASMEEDHYALDDPPLSLDDILLKKILTPPPMYPEEPGPLPWSILLDPLGYISDRTNDTTAAGFTKGGKRIQVTFWVAHPPSASYFTIYSPDQLEIGEKPMILTTDKDVVLLRVPVCPPGCNFDSASNEYFVYEAGTQHKRPKVKFIAIPTGQFLSDSDFGLLRFRHRGMYLVAVLCWTFTYGQYDLHLYNSKTQSWIYRLMHLDSPKPKKYLSASKVIPIGGERGSVGWVDLCRGILICDLLLDSTRLRYIPLPSSPYVANLIDGPPLQFRDIHVLEVKGYIKYFEMCIYMGPGPEVVGWEGATWRRRVSCTETQWKEGFKIKVRNEDTAFSKLPPNLQKGCVLTGPMMKGLYSGFPAVSLHDDDVVYIMDKHNLLDKRASVIAVDMKNQTVKGAADFVSGELLGYSFVYIHSGISRYLGLWSSAR